MASTVFYAMTVQMRQQALRDMPLAATSVPVLYLPGPEPTIVSPLDFSQTSQLIRSAYTATRAYMETLTVDGPGLYRRNTTAALLTPTGGAAHSSPSNLHLG